MLKQLSDCTYVELHDYMVNHLKAIVTKELEFPLSILMFLNNPNLKEMSVKEKRESLQRIMNELKPSVTKIILDLGDDFE